MPDARESLENTRARQSDELASLSALFESVRRRLRESNWPHFDHAGQQAGTVRRTPATVPALHAGWLIAVPETAGDADGLVPLGALRQHLRTASAKAGLTDQEHVCLTAWYGLDGFPLGLGPDEGHLVSLLSNDDRNLSDKQVAQIRRSALSKLLRTLETRHAPDALRYGSVPDPRFSPWFLCLPERVREDTWTSAAASAMHNLSAGSLASNKRQRLLTELYTYLEAVRHHGHDLSHRRDLHRAVAAMSVSLWDVAHPDGTAASAGGRFGTRIAAAAVTAPGVGRSATDSADQPINVEHQVRLIDELNESDGSPMPALNLLLSQRIRSEFGQADDAKVLATAGRLFREREEWEAVRIARQMVHLHPHNPLTIKACFDAAMVACPYGFFDVANRILGVAERLIPGIRSTDDIDPLADRHEYIHALYFARSAVARRSLDSALLSGRFDPELVVSKVMPAKPGKTHWVEQFGRRLAADAENLLNVYRTHEYGGDATRVWVARAELRRAEILQSAALAASLTPSLRTDTFDRLLRQANASLALASEHDAATGETSRSHRRQHNKAMLLQAILECDPDRAAEISAVVAADGMTVYRSALPLSMILSEPGGRPHQGLASHLRPATQAAIDAGLGAEPSERFSDGLRRVRASAAKIKPRASRRAGSTP